MAADNKQIRDGLSNAFTLRMKDKSAAGDGSLQQSMVLSAPFPLDYGAGGFFHNTSKSGSMAAGLAANAPILSFRWTSSTTLAIINRIRMQAWSLGTGFAAGIATFDLFAARTFSAADTGGADDTLTGDNAGLRTSMATSLAEIRHATTGTLTAGTRTLDAQPMDSASFTVGTSTFTALTTAPIKLFEKAAGEHPLVLAQNEGFVIQATVPATGIWAFAITSEWGELPLNLFTAG